jgi:YVTN family beta-propeller protein
MNYSRCCSRGCSWFLALGLGIASAMSMTPAQAQQMCGGQSYPFPYTDVSGVGAPFCPGIMEAYVTGVSKGTTPTTFSPNETVTRLQMTTFLQRLLDQGLRRASKRAALNQWWTPQTSTSIESIFIGPEPVSCAADGENIWTPTYIGNSVIAVQASTGKVLGTWTGATSARAAVSAIGMVFVAGETSPGNLYMIDPTLPPGPIIVVASNLGGSPFSITFDGTKLWTANLGASVSIINPSDGSSTTVSTGFVEPTGILYDGTSIWITDFDAGTLLKLNSSGGIVQTVHVGLHPVFPVYDGANIWVPNQGDNSITVVQASTGSVVATITADASNKLVQPSGASFDGERVLITNFGGPSLTVFKAADLSLIANVPTSVLQEPYGTCSDSVNFWIGDLSGDLIRF